MAEFILLVEALSEPLSLITQFSWWGAFPPRGRSVMNAVAGPRSAYGTGQFNRLRGSGTWRVPGPPGVCSGVWNATRS